MMRFNAVTTPRDSPGILYPAALDRDEVASVGDDLMLSDFTSAVSRQRIDECAMRSGGTMTDR
jgi:hypothetical protein